MRCQTILLPIFAPSSNKDGSRHAQQIDKPLLQHFGMWGGALWWKNRMEKAGQNMAHGFIKSCSSTYNRTFPFQSIAVKVKSCIFVPLLSNNWDKLIDITI